MRRTCRYLLSVVTAAVVLTGGAVTYASFVDQTSNAGNTFQTDATFDETLTPNGIRQSGNWVPVGGGTLDGSLADGINDSTRDQNPDTGGTMILPVSDSRYTTLTGRNVVFRARFARTSATGLLTGTMTLYQGTTAIASRTCTGIGSGWGWCDLTLDASQKAAITDPDDLEIGIGWAGGTLQTLSCSTAFILIS